MVDAATNSVGVVANPLSTHKGYREGALSRSFLVRAPSTVSRDRAPGHARGTQNRTIGSQSRSLNDEVAHVGKGGHFASR